MDELSIPWIDGDWVTASDRALEKRNRQARSSWKDPDQCWQRPWLKNSVKIQTWYVLPHLIVPLCKPDGSPEMLSRDFRAPPEFIILTWRNTTGRIAHSKLRDRRDRFSYPVLRE